MSEAKDRIDIMARVEALLIHLVQGNFPRDYKTAIALRIVSRFAERGPGGNSPGEEEIIRELEFQMSEMRRNS